jgi:hypothetical protein
MSAFESFVVAAMLASLAAACQAPKEPTLGPSGIEVIVARLPPSALAAPVASLTIRGLDSSVLISEPVAAAGSVRHALPPGVYSVGWSGLRADTGAAPAPVVTHVLPGQFATVVISHARSAPCPTTLAASSSALL